MKSILQGLSKWLSMRSRSSPLNILVENWYTITALISLRGAHRCRPLCLIFWCLSPGIDLLVSIKCCLTSPYGFHLLCQTICDRMRLCWYCPLGSISLCLWPHLWWHRSWFWLNSRSECGIWIDVKRTNLCTDLLWVRPEAFFLMRWPRECSQKEQFHSWDSWKELRKFVSLRCWCSPHSISSTFFLNKSRHTKLGDKSCLFGRIDPSNFRLLTL